ncbi:MAG: plasmid pRiA4b ORF-3 family protein [Streptosporangiaceae bacterium]|jgi:hypothetical protein
MPDDPPLDFETLINELLNTDADLTTIEERVLSLGAQLRTAAKSDPDILTSASDFLKAATSSLNQTVRVGGRVFRKEPVPPLPQDAATTIHQVKVSLRGAKPPTWRRLELPSTMTLEALHEVLQIAFDWHALHLHEFETVCGTFGDPDHNDDLSKREDESSVAIAQVAAQGTKVVYEYNFRKEWRHNLVVEKITPAEPGIAYPRCTAGRRTPPHEGSMGLEDYNSYPEEFAGFDLDALNHRLAALGNDR